MSTGENPIRTAKLNARRARLADLHAFTARFIAHGSAAAMKDNKMPFALATVTRTRRRTCAYGFAPFSAARRKASANAPPPGAGRFASGR